MKPLKAPTTENRFGSPWELQVRGTAMEDAGRLIQRLTGAILAHGGWVLSRGANDDGQINMLFEFERQQCVEMYTMLMEAGVELSQLAHMRFTELCQCTRSTCADVGGEIVSVDAEIRSFPAEVMVRDEAAPGAK